MTTNLTVSVPANAAELAALQRDAEALVPALSSIVIDDAASYTEADEMLSEVARRKASVIAMRKEATGPLYQVIRTVEGWFRPLVTALESSERSLKGAMGRYRVDCERREREARELAARAAESGNAEALVEALTVASDAGARPESRATTRFVWRVKSCHKPTMSLEYLVPDLDTLGRLARAHKGDEPPVVSGVTFERVAEIGAKK